MSISSEVYFDKNKMNWADIIDYDRIDGRLDTNKYLIEIALEQSHPRLYVQVAISTTV